MKCFERPRASARAFGCLLLGISACTGSPDRATADTKVSAETREVLVDTASTRAVVSPFAFGIHTSVYDNALHSADLPARLGESGIALLRYPGGGYSDNYHWSTHAMTPFADGNRGYLAAKSDFGNFVGLLERTGTTAMITVNYGSNLDGSGPGEPKEAAAWVAYANGHPDSTVVIGVDATGRDWKTVGHWASMRAAAPLGSADGYDFLRIGHPAPLQIKYWEVGNEVFGNGYYATEGRGYELDLHLPYDAANQGKRFGNEALSPTTYGSNWLEFAREMRNADPTIRVGAVLNTPPKDYQWGPNWNEDVLAACGASVDFVVVHYYPNGTASALVDVPRLEVPQILSELNESFAAHRGENTTSIEVAVTELGPNSDGTSAVDPLATGFFATEAYVTFMEYGVMNLDWLELHNGSFLNERNANVGPAFHGIQMAHAFVGPGDTLVKAKSTVLGLKAHAAVRPDGSVAILLVNSGTTERAGVPVKVQGPPLASAGTRFEYQRLGPATNVDGTVQGPTPMSNLGNEFVVDVPPSTVLAIVIPSASAS